MAAPVTMAGLLQFALGATSASAAALPVQLPSGLAGVTQLLQPHTAPAPATAAGPGASASSHGLNLSILDSCISCTSANATPHHGAAAATGLRLLGNDLAAGASDGNGGQGGALLSLPSNPLLALALADWMAGSSSTGAGSSGDARSALTDLAAGDGQLATLSVLRSMSHAAASGAAGAGGAGNDAAELTLLRSLDVDLLHTGTSQSYLASLNGSPVVELSNSNAIPVSIPGVLDLALLQAQSAAQTGTGSAALGTVSNVLGGSGMAVGVLDSSSQGTSAPAPGSSTAAGTAPSTSGGSGLLQMITGPHTVPETGAFVGLAGLVLVLGGTAVVAGSAPRRRRPTLAV